ncbi:hypothetical protein GDO81_007533 [Engystomops pustulosus]|uniref:C2H2-type domain-containing protein n=1 Tax=Engystomops pustulosus TaxID=76066 RepID=A0AAV7C8S8_ENGPU|nr:hypothetical protein GDO81_007533 [Engystomops pustulosus]
MAPQLIDPEVSISSHGIFSHPDQVFPIASSLYGIQIADHQIRPPSKVTPAVDKNNRKQHGRLFEEQNSSLTIAHFKPSIMKRNGSFPKYYACHLRGRRLNLRSSLCDHLQLHTGIPLSASTGQTETSISPSFCTSGSEMGKESMEPAETGITSDSEMPQISDSPIIDGQQQAETPPPTDIADLDHLELDDQEREVKHRKYECTICGRKFIRKSHWREHMYIHTGKPFKCSTSVSYCRTLKRLIFSPLPNRTGTM